MKNCDVFCILKFGKILNLRVIAINLDNNKLSLRDSFFNKKFIKLTNYHNRRQKF